MELNSNNLLIGANGWARSEDKPDWNRDHFTGTISDFTVYGAQLTSQQVATLAGVEPQAEPSEPYVEEGILYGTLADETLDLKEYPEATIAWGNYGDDLVIGRDDGVILAGGHGQDEVRGGAGDDVLVSFADGREPRIYQQYDPAVFDPDGEILPSGTHFPDQPIEADDVFYGGGGADVFHFRTLVNAKREIILKHVRDDGTIDWHGVTGENDQVHDHWAERIGNEIIMDFNPDEGDHIQFVGHTIDVEKVHHVDLNGDGVVESTVIYIQSEQGNAGAHDNDKLGSVTVVGVLVTSNHYTVNAAPAYGIVETVAELDEALAPKQGTPIQGEVPYGTPDPAPAVAAQASPEGSVLYVPGAVTLAEEAFLEVEHSDPLALPSGSYAMTFTAEEVAGYNALFSKDHTGYQQGGHLTAFVTDGRVKVRFQSDEGAKWLTSPEGSIVAGQQYHLAVTFGAEGFWLYLNGELVAVNTEFTQGMELNSNNLLIGANGWARSEDKPDWNRDHFTGTISDFTVYGAQLTSQQVATLAGVEPQAEPSEPYVEEGILYGTLADETLDLKEYPEATIAWGNYGDDLVIGRDDGVILAGGHGQDEVRGGAGDDVLVSFADGREPRIYQQYDPAVFDPDGEILPSGTHFPDQPIEADDVFYGGGGADVFHFRTLVNAKREIILKHVRDDGTIDWHGVTGENDQVHDHWAERIGNEIIMDFNPDEGDHIQFVGHTIDVEKVHHVDLNGDGVVESTVIYIQSEQGNAGAHDNDKLGSVTVVGVLVTSNHYTVNAAPAYGIVETVAELDEALAPKQGTPIQGEVPYGTPDPAPAVAAQASPEGSVLYVPGAVTLAEEAFLEVEHSDPLALPSGSYAMTFTAEEVAGYNALFSKDHTGYQQGGHLTAFVTDGRVKVRFQSDEGAKWLTSPEGSIVAGQQYHLAVTFGAEGFWLYLNGELVAVNTEFTQGMELNSNNLLIGANGWARSEDKPDWNRDHFTGTISDFTVYGAQLTSQQVATLAGVEPQAEPSEPYVEEGILYGTLADETLDLKEYPEATIAWGNYGDDLVIGRDDGVILAGGHGQDEVRGGAGDDVLVSFADGREPRIYQQYDPAVFDPDGEILPSGTHFPDQPIEADDVFYGGGGADVFHFRTLVNAKREIILKHVRDDGTIDWHGVTGENDQVHDHWAERIGNEIIMDFNPDEGDHIQFVGHTIDVEKVHHVDLNGDGVVESTVIYIQSEQGNAGAHDNDKLGSVTVVGVLVTSNHYTVNAAPAYGIVETVAELDEALAPKQGTPIQGEVPYGTPDPAPAVAAQASPEGSVLYVPGAVTLAEEAFLEVEHSDPLALPSGSYAMTFTAEEVSRLQRVVLERPYRLPTGRPPDRVRHRRPGQGPLPERRGSEVADQPRGLDRGRAAVPPGGDVRGRRLLAVPQWRAGGGQHRIHPGDGAEQQQPADRRQRLGPQ